MILNHCQLTAKHTRDLQQMWRRCEGLGGGFSPDPCAREGSGVSASNPAQIAAPLQKKGTRGWCCPFADPAAAACRQRGAGGTKEQEFGHAQGAPNRPAW